MNRLMELLQEADITVDVDVRRFSSLKGIDGLSQPLNVCVAKSMIYNKIVSHPLISAAT